MFGENWFFGVWARLLFGRLPARRSCCSSNLFCPFGRKSFALTLVRWPKEERFRDAQTRRATRFVRFGNCSSFRCCIPSPRWHLRVMSAAPALQIHSIATHFEFEPNIWNWIPKQILKISKCEQRYNVSWRKCHTHAQLEFDCPFWIPEFRIEWSFVVFFALFTLLNQQFAFFFFFFFQIFFTLKRTSIYLVESIEFKLVINKN